MVVDIESSTTVNDFGCQIIEPPVIAMKSIAQNETTDLSIDINDTSTDFKVVTDNSINIENEVTPSNQTSRPSQGSIMASFPSPASSKKTTLSCLGVGTFSIDHDAVSRGISSGRFTKRNKMRRCGSCTGCNAGNCDKCVNCLNMVKNGGPGNLKQACVERRCINPQTPGKAFTVGSDRQFTGNRVQNQSDKDQFNTSGISTLLPTTTAEMITMEEASTKYILEAVAISANTDNERLLEQDAKLSDPEFENLQSMQQDYSFSDLNESNIEIGGDGSTCKDITNKGFIKMLRRAERYATDFDALEPTRPKLSYGALCALAIQVYLR